MNDFSLLTSVHPALLFMVGALFIPFFSGTLKKAYMLFLPALVTGIVLLMPEGQYWNIQVLDYSLTFGRIDALSRVFSCIFALVTFLAVLFALKVEDNIQHISAFIYAGAALGVTLAGDLFSLYIFWEIMAIASTFLVLVGRTAKAMKAGFRYILMHVLGGLFLLGGILLVVAETGSIAAGAMQLDGPGPWLVFIGIAINAAIPPVHAWLPDSYPESTPTGTVFLSAFTTKSAVYSMARLFAGAEVLIWLGVFMTIIPLVFAEIENDLRKVLSYSLVNQVGFMMVGIGIGTPLALNGTAAHAFCHILYKALLFMSTGAVLQQTGKIKCTEIGGLYRTMPITAICCIVGAASISAFPLTSGFISKSLILSAAGQENMKFVWLLMYAASAGVLFNPGIKLPYFAFFGHDSGLRPKEPPKNMLLAMILTAGLCLFLGVYPKPLYALLPFQSVAYNAYGGYHVIEQLQLLLFGTLAFFLMLKSGYYPSDKRALILDVDWFYRKGVPAIVGGATNFCWKIASSLENVFIKALPAKTAKFSQNPLAFTEPMCEENKCTDVSHTNLFPIGMSIVVASLIFIFVILWLFL